MIEIRSKARQRRRTRLHGEAFSIMLRRNREQTNKPRQRSGQGLAEHIRSEYASFARSQAQQLALIGRELFAGAGHVEHVEVFPREGTHDGLADR